MSKTSCLRLTEEEYQTLMSKKSLNLQELRAENLSKSTHKSQEIEDIAPKIKTRERKPNKTEQRMANLLNAQKKTGMIHDFTFEGVTVKLAPDTRYTPDFSVTNLDGSLTLIEVKGGHIWEDGLLKFKLAMDKYPCFTWEMWQWQSKESKFIKLRGNCK